MITTYRYYGNKTEYQNKHYNTKPNWLQHVQKMDTDYKNKQEILNQKWLQYAQRIDKKGNKKQALQYKSTLAIIC